MAEVNIPGQGVHNVLYVATEHDSLYAFDADNGVRLWRVSLLPAGEVPSDPRGAANQIGPEIGVTATPVIDSGHRDDVYRGAMSKSTPAGVAIYHQRIHAVSIATGADVVAPRSIDQSITFPGAGPGGNGTVVFFDPAQYKERSALLLSGGVIYTGWASHSDTPPYTGWIIGFRASDLGVASILNIDPNGLPVSSFLDDGSGNTFWNSGNGFAADAQGNLYNISANGPFDPVLDANGFPANGDYADSFLKITPGNGTLTVTDYFTPTNQQLFADSDFDLASSGIALVDVPGPGGVIEHLALGSDKVGNIYVANRDNLGKFSLTGDNVQQELVGALAGAGGVWGSPTISMAASSTSPPSASRSRCSGSSTGCSCRWGRRRRPRSATLDVDDDGLLQRRYQRGSSTRAAENGPNAVLHAYLATNLSVELYNSNQAPGGRDQFGVGNKFITPTVVNERQGLRGDDRRRRRLSACCRRRRRPSSCRRRPGCRSSRGR